MRGGGKSLYKYFVVSVGEGLCALPNNRADIIRPEKAPLPKGREAHTVVNDSSGNCQSRVRANRSELSNESETEGFI